MYEETETHNKIGIQFFAEPGGSNAGDTGTDGGAAPQTGTDGQAAAAGTPANPATPPAKTFTQDDVNTMMANEKRTARLALLKELGYEVKDGDYKKAISLVKGILDQGKTQQQLDQEARTKAEGDLASEQARNSQLQAQLDVMKAGVKPDYVDDAIAMLMPRVTQDKPLTKLLEEYKTKYPAWFGETTGSAGTGSATNPPRGKGGEIGSMGKRLAQANTAPTKSNFFKN